MNEQLKKIRDEQTQILTEARSFLDDMEKAGEDESRHAELEASHDKAMKRYDELEEKAKTEEERDRKRAELAERQSKLEEIDRDRRPGTGQQRAGRETGAEDRTAEELDKVRREAFGLWLRGGNEALGPEHRDAIREARAAARQVIDRGEARAQATTTAGAGGALVPEDFMNEIMRSMADWGPMNDDNIVRVLNTSSGADMPFPSVDDTAQKGALIAENTQVSPQDITFSTVTLGAYKYTTGLVLVSAELLQDAVFNVEELVRSLLAERIARIHNEHLTTGTGSSQPNGIATAATAGVTAASTSAFTADEILDLEHSVDPAYRRSPRCRFQMNDTSLKAIRKLKDGQGNYLWQQADLRAGTPNMILGYPYSINQDLDSAEEQSPSGDNVPVIFGDHDKYVVRRVRALSVARLNERYADYDQVGFVGFTRMDGDLIDTAAIKKLTMAST